MSTLGMYELTHPELLSESDLKEILENIYLIMCENLSYRCPVPFELIELYKRVALPLPQRQSESTQNSDIRQHNEAMYSVNESYRNPVSLNGTSTRKIDVNETAKEIFCTRPKSSANELKQTSNKIRLYNSNTFTKCNGIDKRNNDGKHDEAPSKKRQKITWP